MINQKKYGDTSHPLRQAMEYYEKTPTLPSSPPKQKPRLADSFETRLAALKARHLKGEPLFDQPDKYEALQPITPQIYELHPRCSHQLDGHVKWLRLDNMVVSRTEAGGQAGPKTQMVKCRHCSPEQERLARIARTSRSLERLTADANIPEYAKPYRLEANPNEAGAFPSQLDQDTLFSLREEVASTIEALRAGNMPKNLFLFGASGGGKTILASMLIRRLMEEGFASYFVLVSRFFQEVQKTYNRQAQLSEDEVRYEENILQVPVLVLDDLGAEAPSDWALRKIFLIIEERQAKGLFTIITSNNRLQGLRKYWHKSYADPDIQQQSGRIVRRLQDYYSLFFVEGGAQE